MCLISGCPRSGTAYIARFLQANGIRVKHEVEDTDGIVSWLFLQGIKQHGRLPVPRPFHQYYPILHQVRYPLHTIASLHTIHPSSWDYFKQFLPLSEDPVVAAMQVYLYWNRMIEAAADYSYAVEHLPLSLNKLRELLKVPLDAKYCDLVNPKTNSREHAELTWMELRDCSKDLTDEVFEYGRRFYPAGTPIQPPPKPAEDYVI